MSMDNSAFLSRYHAHFSLEYVHILYISEKHSDVCSYNARQTGRMEVWTDNKGIHVTHADNTQNYNIKQFSQY